MPQSKKAAAPAASPAKQVATTQADLHAIDALRRKIDEIDFALLASLRDRAEIVDQVRKLKGKQHIYIRPGREAQQQRVLAGMPHGKLPEGFVMHLWRQIIGGFTLIEGAPHIAVYAPAKGPDLWDHARDHFGSLTPMTESPSAHAAIEAVKAGKADVAVVPPLPASDKDSWWPMLAADTKNNLTIFACLPFEVPKVGKHNARNALPMGLLVGKLYPELTGDDRSFLAMHCSHVLEQELRRLVGKAGYKLRALDQHSMGRSSDALTIFLVEVEGFVGRNDTRLGRLRAMLGSRLKHLAPMGGYAVPLKPVRGRA